MPGRPVSAEPAIEGPASTKAMARIKLSARIRLSPDFAADAVRRSCGQLRNHAAFPEFFAKAENGFVAPEICFVAMNGRHNPRWYPAGRTTVNRNSGGPY